jgi:protocatechuate 3,4-dioxygenase beta subunit
MARSARRAPGKPSRWKNCMGYRRLVFGLAMAIVILGTLTLIGVSVLNRIPGPISFRGSASSERGKTTKEHEDKANSDSFPIEDIQAEPDATDVQFASIRGKITDLEGTEVPLAHVLALESRAWAEVIEHHRVGFETDPLKVMRTFQESLAGFAARLPSTRSGNDGTYQLRGLPEGDYRVLVIHPHFVPYQEEDWITVEAGKTAHYDVELVPGLRISGKVLDPAGKPIAGASLKATPSGTARLRGMGKMIRTLLDQHDGKSLLPVGQAETDEVGSFRLTSLEPGPYDVRVRKDGHGGTEALGVPAGTEGIAISLYPGLRISGRVLDPARNPISGADVLLRVPQPEGWDSFVATEPDIFGELERPGLTDVRGRFELVGYQRGTYELVIAARGFLSQKGPLKLEGKGQDIGDILLEGGQSIAGKVYGPEGAPIEGASVWAVMPEQNPSALVIRRIVAMVSGPSSRSAQAVTARDGAFKLECLEDRSFDIVAASPGFPGQIAENIGTGTDDLRITMEYGLIISGRVIDGGSGKPVVGANVAVNGIACGKSGFDGRFEVGGVPRDWHELMDTITIWAESDGYLDASEALAPPSDKAVAATTPVVIKLRRREAFEGIHGIIRDGRGAAVAGARVWIEMPGSSYSLSSLLVESRSEVHTDGDGGFSIAVPVKMGVSEFEVAASHRRCGKGRSAPLRRPGAEQDWPSVEIRLSPGGILEGRVTEAGASPIAGARIEARRDIQLDGPEAFLSELIPRSDAAKTYSSKDGSYRFRRIEHGNYLVEARATGYVTRTLGPVPLGEGATVLDFVLDRGGILKGRVVDNEGKPLAGIEVVAFTDVRTSGDRQFPPDDSMASIGAQGRTSAKTDASGNYELTLLPEGEFCLLARAAGYDRTTISSAIPDRPVPDMVLTPLAQLSGRTVDGATGMPVPRYEVRFEKERMDRSGTYSEEPGLRRQVEERDGRFETSLEAGDYIVKVNARDYLSWSRPIHLAPGQDLAIEAALGQGGRIEGRVRTREGRPVADAKILIQKAPDAQSGNGDFKEEWVSGSDGRFSARGLKDGEYRVWIRHPDYYVESPAGPIAVQVPFVSSPGLEVMLGRAGRLEGTIKNFLSTEESTVILTRIADETPRRGTSGETEEDSGGVPREAEDSCQAWWYTGIGDFRAVSLKPGKYRIVLHMNRPSGEAGEASESPDPEVEIRNLGEVEIRPGETARFEAPAH